MVEMESDIKNTAIGTRRRRCCCGLELSITTLVPEVFGATDDRDFAFRQSVTVGSLEVDGSSVERIVDDDGAQYHHVVPTQRIGHKHALCSSEYWGTQRWPHCERIVEHKNTPKRSNSVVVVAGGSGAIIVVVVVIAVAGGIVVVVRSTTTTTIADRWDCRCILGAHHVMPVEAVQKDLWFFLVYNNNITCWWII